MKLIVFSVKKSWWFIFVLLAKIIAIKIIEVIEPAKENHGKYICDTCLIDIYQNHKQIYFDSITDSKKRRTFRVYFGGKVGLLTRTQQKQLASSELHDILTKKGINLAEDGLGDYLENWRQITLKLVQENSLQAKQIRDLEKKVAKKTKKV